MTPYEIDHILLENHSTLMIMVRYAGESKNSHRLRILVHA